MAPLWSWKKSKLLTQAQEPQEVDVSDEVIAASNEHGEILFDELLEHFGEMEDDGLDPICVVYHLWIAFIYVLVQHGWTHKDLAKDLAHHANNDVEGHA